MTLMLTSNGDTWRVCCRSGRCHGVALWMEYHLTKDVTVSAGLIGAVGEQVRVRFFSSLPFKSARFPSSQQRGLSGQVGS